MRLSTGILVLAAGTALLWQKPAAAQEAAAPAAETRLEVIRLHFADARMVAAALGALRPPDLRGAAAYVPNNQLITLWGPGGAPMNGFVTGAFGSPFFNNGFGQRQRGAVPPAAARPNNGNGGDEQNAPPAPPPQPQAVR